jgi:hypothetical protein
LFFFQNRFESHTIRPRDLIKASLSLTHSLSWNSSNFQAFLLRVSTQKISKSSLPVSLAPARRIHPSSFAGLRKISSDLRTDVFQSKSRAIKTQGRTINVPSIRILSFSIFRHTCVLTTITFEIFSHTKSICRSQGRNRYRRESGHFELQRHDQRKGYSSMESGHSA